MNYIKDVELKVEDNVYNMIVEIKKHSKIKTELKDKTFDKLEKAKKFKYRYPFYYGCFPQTMSGDKEPLDVILFSRKKHNQLDIVKVTPITVLTVKDNDEEDNKVIVVPTDEYTKSAMRYINSLLKFVKKCMKGNTNVRVSEYLMNIIETKKVIDKDHIAYLKKETPEDNLGSF